MCILRDNWSFDIHNYNDVWFGGRDLHYSCAECVNRDSVTIGLLAWIRLKRKKISNKQILEIYFPGTEYVCEDYILCPECAKKDRTVKFKIIEG